MPLKVCGVRSMPMAQSCQDLSVPYIGFNFVPSSKRFINAIEAQKLSHAFTGKKVGVFQNTDITQIFETASLVDLDIIQLHGQESAQDIETIKQKLSPIKPFEVWKAFAVDENFDVKVLQQYGKNCDLFLFDGKTPGSGTQIVHNQVLLDALSESEKLNIPYGLAGGINATNARDIVLKFPQVQLLDTASGVETAGEFEAEKLTLLLNQLKDE